MKILVAAGADCKQPRKAEGYGDLVFHPLTLTAFTKDESIAADIAAHLVVAGGATSAAADNEAITIFHRLVACNRVQTVETLLRVDPSAKTASRFLATDGSAAVAPITTSFAYGHRAMSATLIAHASSRAFIDRETFDRSVAAT